MVMSNKQSWLSRKMTEPCSCKSELAYKNCCYHREALYFVVGAGSGLALFLGRHVPLLNAVVPLLLIIAWRGKIHYDKKRDELKGELNQ